MGRQWWDLAALIGEDEPEAGGEAALVKSAFLDRCHLQVRCISVADGCPKQRAFSGSAHSTHSAPRRHPGSAPARCARRRCAAPSR